MKIGVSVGFVADWSQAAMQRYRQFFSRHPDENRDLGRLCRGLVSGGNAEIPAYAGMTKEGTGMTILYPQTTHTTHNFVLLLIKICV